MNKCSLTQASYGSNQTHIRLHAACITLYREYNKYINTIPAFQLDVNTSKSPLIAPPCGWIELPALHLREY